MEGTTVQRGLPPTLPFKIGAADRQMFMNQLASGTLSRKPQSGSLFATSMGGGATGATTVGPSSTEIGPLPSSVTGNGTLLAERGRQEPPLEAQPQESRS